MRALSWSHCLCLFLRLWATQPVSMVSERLQRKLSAKTNAFWGSWDHAVAPTMLYSGRPSYIWHFRESPSSATRWNMATARQFPQRASSMFKNLCDEERPLLLKCINTLLFTCMITKPHLAVKLHLIGTEKSRQTWKDFTTSAGRLEACIETSQRLCFCHGMNWRNGLEMLQVTEEKLACVLDGTHKYVRQAKPSTICESTICSAQKNLGKALTKLLSLTMSVASTLFEPEAAAGRNAAQEKVTWFSVEKCSYELISIPRSC